MIKWRMMLLLCLCAVAPARGAVHVLNQDGETYDSHPSAVITKNGDTWLAWHAYHRNHDRVLARRIASDGTTGPIHEVSDANTLVNGPPKIVATKDSIWVVWAANTRGHKWRIQARRFSLAGKKWASIETISATSEVAIHPTVSKTDGGSVAVAWSGHRNGEFRIRLRQWNQSWSDSIELSDPGVDAYRPTIEGGYVFWDEYDGAKYSVKGRAIHPQFGEIESISPTAADCLTPTAVSTSRGLFVAWLRKVDVIGGPGIVSQMHTLQAARRSADGSWRLIRDAQGGDHATELTQGLMVRLKPTIVATGGYLGRRTAPMLLATGDAVWLLWERKSDHRGRTPDVVGDLLGRPIVNSVWGKPVQLHTGRVDYHLPHPAVSDEDGSFSCLASKLPRKYRRIYELTDFNLNETTPFKQDKWTDWKPVQLPIAEEQPLRRSVKIDGEVYRLYWGDFHCHSGLTSDAEGEADEMMFYARDRAKLDVVAFTNNDFVYDVPLTAYEYAVGNLLARLESQPRKFVALPGYEWTSRVPGVEGVPDSDPANYTSPYQNKSYPNHRSVIYPPAGGPLIHYHENGNNIDSLHEAVQRVGGVTLTQHIKFRRSGHPVEVGIELTSGWGNYINRAPERFHAAVKEKPRMAFVACGDTHRRTPGLAGALTGLYLKELTPAAVLDALRNRRCFATAGAKMLLDSRANNSFMGQDTKARDGSVTVTLHVIGTRPIAKAILLRDGKQIAEFDGAGKEHRFQHVDQDLSPGTHWYYWQVDQAGEVPIRLPGNNQAAHGHRAWSTPHWVIVE
ncbi:MAG: hypothetical protein CMO80_06795 [Verrucomicrobiales bacterium]|nr:hypothetical protein [Verrucomicrobiales bacterium]|tara:strand:- start:495 stop:2867 length:2373 start_codon:yes stop_codon:yes gene_type:complete